MCWCCVGVEHDMCPTQHGDTSLIEGVIPM